MTKSNKSKNSLDKLKRSVSRKATRTVLKTKKNSQNIYKSIIWKTCKTSMQND
jgi:hypothetical protein